MTDFESGAGTPTSPGGITVSKEELAQRLRLATDRYETMHGRQPSWAVVEEHVKAAGVDLSRTKWHYMLSGSHVLAKDIGVFEALGDLFDIPSTFFYRAEEDVPPRLQEAMPAILDLRRNRVRREMRSIGEISPEAEAAMERILAELEAE